MYRIIKDFKDKNTGAKYKVGDVVEFTEKRAKEILKVGKLIEKIEEEKTIEEVVETTEEIVEEKPRKRAKK